MSSRLRRKALFTAAGLWLLVCSLGQLLSTAPKPTEGPGPVVRLMRAPLPSALGWVAQHYWFAVGDEPGALHRWEVWQGANQSGVSWGHVHKDLGGWDRPVGGGPAELVAEWRGPVAERFVACIRDAAPRYPDREQYRAWPGPNSNTFVEAMLRTCQVSWTLDGTAIGKDYRGWVGASMTSGRTGVQVESPLVGILVGLDEGLQLHVVGLTLGVDVWPPAILTPFGNGRFGFGE